MLEIIHIILRDIANLPIITQITAVLVILFPIMFSKTERFRVALQIGFLRVFKMNYSRDTKISLYANSLFRTKELHLAIVEKFSFKGSEIKTDIYRLLLNCIIKETDRNFNFRISNTSFGNCSVPDIVRTAQADIKIAIFDYGKKFEQKLHAYFKKNPAYHYDKVVIELLAFHILSNFREFNKKNVLAMTENIEFISESAAFSNSVNAYHYILENVQLARHKGILQSFVFFENMNGFIEKSLAELKK